MELLAEVELHEDVERRHIWSAAALGFLFQTNLQCFL